MEINDCWSLLDVVKECARITQLQAQRNTETETNLTTSVTTANIGPFETNCSAVSFTLPSAAAPAAAEDSVPIGMYKRPRGQLNAEINPTSATSAGVGPLKTNYSTVNFTLPSAAALAAAQGSVPIDMYKRPRGRLNMETSLTTSATLTTASVGPLKSNYLIANFTLPSAAAATPAAAQGRVSKVLAKPPLPPPYHHHHSPPHVISTTKTPMTQATNLLVVQQNPPQQPPPRNFSNTGNLGSSTLGVDHHCFYKRKKLGERRVVKCSLQELARNDNWAWRKYGRKPIKGSPYPRNYYRCSSMKGCNARRQIERSLIHPSVYIVTYTSNHLHPPPPIRIFNKPPVKYSGSEMDPPLDPKSPVETVPGQIGSGCESRLGTTVQGQTGSEYGSGSRTGSGSGGNVVKSNEDKRHDSGGNGLGSGVMDKGNKKKDRENLIPKLMAGSDLLTDLEQLGGGEKVGNICTCSSRINRNYYNEEHKKKRDPNVKMDAQVKGKRMGKSKW